MPASAAISSGWPPPAQAEEPVETTTTQVPRVVGEAPPAWAVWGAGAALLAAILVAGYLVRRRMQRQP